MTRRAANVVRFPAGFKHARAIDIDERRSSGRQMSAILRCAVEEREQRRWLELESRRLRPGAVIGINPATALWVRDLEPRGRNADVRGTRHFICGWCEDREVCDWKTWGCDKQVNVTRFFEGKKAPIYREEEKPTPADRYVDDD